MFGDDRVRPFSYTYRDYVIRAFNEDLGFDRFVQDQLAADVDAPRDQPWRLAAMGLLTVGKGFDNNIHDQLDDRIDVVTRGFLGLTVSCARCHDHKYDAIPTADYYSLYGIFASSVAPLELPLIERLGLRTASRPSSRSSSRPSGARSASSSRASTSSSPRRRVSGPPITWCGPPRPRPTRSRRRSSTSRSPPRTCGRRSSRAGAGWCATGRRPTIPSSDPGTT